MEDLILNFNRDWEESKAKNITYRATKRGNYYCVLRVGRSFKNLGEIKQYEMHTERMRDTPNANSEIENRILIGEANLTERVKEYISDCKYNKANTTIAREMTITASPDYFKNMPKEEFHNWVKTNVNWLNEKYGDNVLYATLHLDEKTPHIHVLMVPKTYSEKRKCHVLSSRSFFGSKLLLRQLQDEYGKVMNEAFPSLNRGIRNSKAKHIEIKHFYGIINNVRTEENAQTIFKNDILLKAKIKALEGTLEAYMQECQKQEKNSLEANKLVLELSQQVKELKKNNDLYKGIVKELSQRYKLPMNAIEMVMKHIKNKGMER
jgi:hypothetical protein